MDREQVIKIAEEVANDHGCHTVILYGSWARGDATASSDVDLVCVRKEGGAMQDARHVAGVFVDAFIYPESALDEKDPSLLRLLGGVVVREQDGFGDMLLAAINNVHDRGPNQMPGHERRARIAWAQKMLERILGSEDPESNYRRMFLLMQSLEDYFALRDRWFRGSKEAFAWLRANDAPTYSLFETAFLPASPYVAIAHLVTAVYSPSEAG